MTSYQDSKTGKKKIDLELIRHLDLLSLTLDDYFQTPSLILPDAGDQRQARQGPAAGPHFVPAQRADVGMQVTTGYHRG